MQSVSSGLVSSTVVGRNGATQQAERSDAVANQVGVSMIGRVPSGELSAPQPVEVLSEQYPITMPLALELWAEICSELKQLSPKVKLASLRKNKQAQRVKGKGCRGRRAARSPGIVLTKQFDDLNHQIVRLCCVWIEKGMQITRSDLPTIGDENDPFNGKGAGFFQRDASRLETSLYRIVGNLNEAGIDTNSVGSKIKQFLALVKKEPAKLYQRQEKSGTAREGLDHIIRFIDAGLYQAEPQRKQLTRAKGGAALKILTDQLNGEFREAQEQFKQHLTALRDANQLDFGLVDGLLSATKKLSQAQLSLLQCVRLVEQQFRNDNKFKKLSYLISVQCSSIGVAFDYLNPLLMELIIDSGGIEAEVIFECVELVLDSYPTFHALAKPTEDAAERQLSERWCEAYNQLLRFEESEASSGTLLLCLAKDILEGCRCHSDLVGEKDSSDELEMIQQMMTAFTAQMGGSKQSQARLEAINQKHLAKAEQSLAARSSEPSPNTRYIHATYRLYVALADKLAAALQAKRQVYQQERSQLAELQEAEWRMIQRQLDCNRHPRRSTRSDIRRQLPSFPVNLESDAESGSTDTSIESEGSPTVSDEDGSSYSESDDEGIVESVEIGDLISRFVSYRKYAVRGCDIEARQQIIKAASQAFRRAGDRLINVVNGEAIEFDQLVATIDCLRRMVEAGLRTQLASMDFVGDGERHALIDPETNQEREFGHHLVPLAGALRGAEQTTPLVRDMIQQHWKLLEQLSYANQVLHYRSNLPDRTERGLQDLARFIEKGREGLWEDKPDEQQEVIRILWHDYVAPTLELLNALRQPDDAASATVLSQELQQWLNRCQQAESVPFVPAANQYGAAIRVGRARSVPSMPLPKISSTGDAYVAAGQVEQLVTLIKQQATYCVGWQKGQRDQRDRVLNNLAFQLDALEGNLAREQRGSVDTWHAIHLMVRALREVHVAALWHQPLYDEETGRHLIDYADSNGRSLDYETDIVRLNSELHRHGDLPVNTVCLESDPKLTWLKHLYQWLNVPERHLKTADQRVPLGRFIQRLDKDIKLMSRLRGYEDDTTVQLGKREVNVGEKRTGSQTLSTAVEKLFLYPGLEILENILCHGFPANDVNPLV